MIRFNLLSFDPVQRRWLWLLIMYQTGVSQAQTVSTYALQEPFAARYWEVPVTLNPAASGTAPRLRATALGRTQFISARNAPFYLILSGDVGFKSFGVGLVVNYLSYGSALDTVSSGMRISNARLAGAYHFSFPSFRISIGLEAGFVNKQFRYPGTGIINSQTRPDVGAGLWISGEHMFLGAALQHIAPMRFSEIDDSVASRRTFVFTAGYQPEATQNARPYAMALLRSDFRYLVADLNAGASFRFFNLGALFRPYVFPGEPRLLTKFGAQAAGVLYNTEQISFALCYTFETFVGRRAPQLNRAAFHEIGAVFRLKAPKSVVIEKAE
ncbi:MAG: type IX secretion system membrane protein PorP/SprF [Flavobacteriales bacterium]|nr:type IX secretion system membrane protein PorP/SprF [Flavobacteriales bacterium]